MEKIREKEKVIDHRLLQRWRELWNTPSNETPPLRGEKQPTWASCTQATHEPIIRISSLQLPNTFYSVSIAKNLLKGWKDSPGIKTHALNILSLNTQLTSDITGGFLNIERRDY